MRAHATLLFNMNRKDCRYRMCRFAIQLMDEISMSWIVMMSVGVDEDLGVTGLATEIVVETSIEIKCALLNRKHSSDLSMDSLLYLSVTGSELKNSCDVIRETVRDLSTVVRSRS